LICTLSIHGYRFTFKHLCWHSITKILRNGPRAHFPFNEALNGPMLIHEPQTVALKATSSREGLPSKVAQVEAAGLNEDEMALIIKRFKTALKGRKEHPNKSKMKEKRSCFKCGKIGHFIANCPDNDSDQE
jgi:hypothetical protein